MIYPQLLRSDFDKLPRALHDFHSTAGGGRAAGRVAVRRARGLLPRLSGFPPSGDDLPAKVEVMATDQQEVWTRQFGDGMLRSVQWIKGDLLVEAMGPLRIYFRVAACETGLRFQLVRARLLGMPIPLRIEATAMGGESSWEFEVKIAHVGSYRGVMEPVA